jgi:hypothetical protein
MIIQGRRMPSGDEVRSLILPKNGLPSIATTAPIPVTRAKPFGARSIPTSELIFNARVTRRGARSTRTVPRYANVYSEMKTQPTRRTAGDSGSSAATRQARVVAAIDLARASRIMSRPNSNSSPKS